MDYLSSYNSLHHVMCILEFLTNCNWCCENCYLLSVKKILNADYSVVVCYQIFFGLIRSSLVTTVARLSMLAAVTSFRYFLVKCLFCLSVAWKSWMWLFWQSVLLTITATVLFRLAWTLPYLLSGLQNMSSVSLIFLRDYMCIVILCITQYLRCVQIWLIFCV